METAPLHVSITSKALGETITYMECELTALVRSFEMFIHLPIFIFFLSLLYHDDRIWHCNVYNNYCLCPILFIDSGESRPYLHGIFKHQYVVLDVKRVETGGVILIDIYEDKSNLKDLTYRKIIEKHLEIIINLDQGQNTTKKKKSCFPCFSVYSKRSDRELKPFVRWI